MFSYHFMQNALLAGTIVALVAGIVGYFMVLRGESFAGHSLANIGFAGAAGAALLGVPVVVGLIGLGVLGALGMGALGMGALGDRVSQSRGRNDVAVGAILALALGFGVLFERLSSAKASSVYAILFGSPLGVADADLREIALTAVVTLLVIALIARPLLFASLDPVVAASAWRACTPAFLWVFNTAGACRSTGDAGRRRTAHLRAAGRARRDGTASDRAPGTWCGALGRNRASHHVGRA